MDFCFSLIPLAAFSSPRPPIFVLAATVLFAATPLQAGAAGSARPGIQAAAATPVPTCRLEGEIGSGRAVITSRGAGVGYRGTFSWTMAATPQTTFSITSDFTPHRRPVDRIQLTIASTEGEPSLSGGFGAARGPLYAAERGGSGLEAAWFAELMSGRTLTARSGSAEAGLVYPRERFETDYDLMLDLLQIVAGWEDAGLCRNRVGD